MVAINIEENFWKQYQENQPFVYWMQTSLTHLLQVDWKSQKKLDHSFVYKNKIPSQLLKALKNVLLTRECELSSQTQEALRSRNLIDDNRNLTDHGRILAIAQLPLKTQCEYLSLPFSQSEVVDVHSPEQTLIRMLASINKQAIFLENNFSLFINFLMVDAFYDVTKKLNKPLFGLAFHTDLENFFMVKRDLESYLNRFDNKKCERNYILCKRDRERMYFDFLIAPNFSLFKDLYRAFSLNQILQFIKMYFSNPLAYYLRGWPDLIVFGDSEPYFVEIKTTDKLHLHQLVTIPDLIKWTGTRVEVVQLLNNSY